MAATWEGVNGDGDSRPERGIPWIPGEPVVVVGLIYLIYLYRRDPRRVLEVGLVHLDRLETDEA